MSNNKKLVIQIRNKNKILYSIVWYRIIILFHHLHYIRIQRLMHQNQSLIKFKKLILIHSRNSSLKWIINEVRCWYLMWTTRFQEYIHFHTQWIIKEIRSPFPGILYSNGTPFHCSKWINISIAHFSMLKKLYIVRLNI